MKQSFVDESLSSIQTTVGDLIALLSDIAAKNADSEEEGYYLTSLALQDLLQRSQQGGKEIRVSFS